MTAEIDWFTTVRRIVDPSENPILERLLDEHRLTDLDFEPELPCEVQSKTHDGSEHAAEWHERRLCCGYQRLVCSQIKTRTIEWSAVAGVTCRSCDTDAGPDSLVFTPISASS